MPPGRGERHAAGVGSAVRHARGVPAVRRAMVAIVPAQTAGRLTRYDGDHAILFDSDVNMPVIRLLMAGCMTVVLVGCGTPSTRPADAIAIDAVTREIRSGTAHSFDRFAWLPGSVGFRLADAAVNADGQLVLTHDALHWGRFDTASGWYRVARKIPLNQIRSVSLAQSDAQRLIVVEGPDGKFDSFGVIRHRGARKVTTESDPVQTSHAYRLLLAQMGF